MVGRAGLLYTIGFGLILGSIARNLNSYAVEAAGTMGAYYDATASHNIALTGANVGLAKFYQDTTWRGSMTQTLTLPGAKGTFTATSSNAGTDRVRVQSISSYSTWYAGTIHDTIEVYFNRNRQNSFSMFAWMTNVEGSVNWITGDTVWGRVHSNSNLVINGKPVFYEKVTTTNQFSPRVGTSPNRAIFKKGYETGVARIDLPTDISSIITASTGGGKHYTTDIWVTLAPGTAASGDGKVLVRATQTGPVIDTIALNNPSFNGVILGDGRVNVQGTLDGVLSIASKTDVYIQDDIRYERSPLSGPTDDVLGLVANNNVVVAKNAANNNDCHIDGAVFARSGSFMAEDYSGRPVSGKLELCGSIVQNTRGAVGQFSGSTITSGFSKRYRYDPRFEDPNFRPPFYPGYFVRTYAITNWWESYRLSSL